MGALDTSSGGAGPCQAPTEIRVDESVAQRPVSVAAYQQLAEFRFQIRSFLHFSENAVRQTGIEPQQHQLMLALKGLGPGMRPTVTALAHRLCLKHHSTVELINRLERRGAVIRTPSEHDRREVLIQLTAYGE